MENVLRNFVLLHIKNLIFIFHRGSSSNQTQIFSPCYGRLAELRSLMSQKVPAVALTATATSDTMQFINENLCMYNTKMFIATPERTNIKYTVINIASRDPFDLLYSIVQNLTEKGYEADKVLVFCRILSDVRRIYKCFDIALREKYKDYIKRPFGDIPKMFELKTYS